MPPKRATRTSSRASTGGQGILSFSKAQPNRITKPGSSPRSTKTKKHLQENGLGKTEALESEDLKLTGPPASADPLAQPAPASTEDVLGGRASPEPEEDEQEGADELDAREVADDKLARGMSQAKVKAYWREKENARLAPRVHQQDLSLAEKVLREWDMSGQYGPCIGITRIARWRRARRLGLEPPVEVLAVLLGRLDGRADVPGPGVEERAYVDVLMGNRVGVVA